MGAASSWDASRGGESVIIFSLDGNDRSAATASSPGLAPVRACLVPLIMQMRSPLHLDACWTQPLLNLSSHGSMA
jgi:hypothetical protein